MRTLFHFFHIANRTQLTNRRVILLLSVVLALNAANANADVTNPPLKLLNPTPDEFDLFGTSLTAIGNRIYVGAPGDDRNAINAGNVYVFDGTTGTLLHEIPNPTKRSGELFGHSLATLGNDVVVGCESSGTAYLFDGATNELKQTFTGIFGAQRFGFSIAADDGKVLIGAPGNNPSAVGGAAYLYDAVSGNLLRTFPNPSSMEFELFGESVALHNGTAFIGAAGDQNNGGVSAGAMYMYNISNGALERTIFDPTPSPRDDFGDSIAVSNGVVVVGSTGDDFGGMDIGAAHLFDVFSGQLLRSFSNPNHVVFDQFGRNTAFIDDLVVVSAPRSYSNPTRVGSVYIFDSASGRLVQSIHNPNPSPDSANFGEALARLGSRLVVGDPENDAAGTNSGIAYVFDIVPEPTTNSLIFILAVSQYASVIRSWRRR
jgi:outer membrane protein assembly factor BamB